MPRFAKRFSAKDSKITRRKVLKWRRVITQGRLRLGMCKNASPFFIQMSADLNQD